MKTSIKTASGKPATITVNMVGQSFGCVGVLRVQGKRVYETDTLPLGFDGAAVENCKEKAAKL